MSKQDNTQEPVTTEEVVVDESWDDLNIEDAVSNIFGGNDVEIEAEDTVPEFKMDEEVVWEMLSDDEPEEEVKVEGEITDDKEVPKEEEKVEWEIKSDEEVPAGMSDDDLLKSLEEDLNKVDEAVKATEEPVKNIEEVLADGKVDSSEYNSLVEDYNNIVSSLDIVKNEVANKDKIINRLKEKVNEQALSYNEKELDSSMTAPITNVINADNNLKGFALAMNRAETEPELKERALWFLYNFLEKETGTNIKELITKQLEDAKAALTSKETWGGKGSIIEVNKEEYDMQDILNNINS